MIQINHQLEILANNKIQVPGCEPTSALSSNLLSSWLAELGCNNALVDVNLALAAIPGSYVKIGSNYNVGNRRQKWFVLPPIGTDCPCQSYEDFYEILRGISDTEELAEESLENCGVNDMGYCPSPEFDEFYKPPASTYKQEGTFPAGVGVLPPIPPWGTTGT